jgi:hypothetical protein
LPRLRGATFEETATSRRFLCDRVARRSAPREPVNRQPDNASLLPKLFARS